MLILRVGDPHAKANNIEEMESLLTFVLEMARLHKVNRIELLGDLFHTHAIIRLEVLDLWDRWLEKLSQEFETVVLVGNHDQTGDKNSKLHALKFFRNLKGNLVVVDDVWFSGAIGYMSYKHDNDAFVQTANHLATLGAKLLVCHQTFKEAKYESGMYAPDSIDASLINIPNIISGHIHGRQRFGKVIYPGTARWDSSADANQPKGLWLVNHDDSTGAIIKEEFLDTSPVCSPIVSFKWIEGDPEPTIAPGTRASVDLIGSSDWVSQKKAILKGKASVSTKITDKKNTERRKSGDNLEFFVKNLYDTKIDRDQLLEYMKELKIL